MLSIRKIYIDTGLFRERNNLDPTWWNNDRWLRLINEDYIFYPLKNRNEWHHLDPNIGLVDFEHVFNNVSDDTKMQLIFNLNLFRK